MHTIYLRTDEDLGDNRMRDLQAELRAVGHITDVEINSRTPRDILVEFEEAFISPMEILKQLQRKGIHADIMSG